MVMMVSFVLSFFPRDVLDEILNLIESVSEDFPSYSCITTVITKFKCLSELHFSLKSHMLEFIPLQKKKKGSRCVSAYHCCESATSENRIM